MTPKVLFLFLIFTVIGVRAWNVRITPHEDELIRPTGKNVYVVCQVELDEGGPEERPSIRWLKNGQEVNAFNVRPTRKLPLTNKYHKTLFLNNPTLNDGGKFTCEARIAGETQQQEVEISFKEAAKFDPTTERDQHPDEGADEARVYCKVEGYDIEVDWLFNSTAVEETHRNYEFENDGQTLVIPKFDSAKDNGIYTCRWQQFNTFGALNISVIAHEKPKIGMFPFAGNSTAFEGQSAQFQCQAAGKPKPTIHWFYIYQNGSEVELLPSDKHNSTKGVLKIRKVSMTDAGTYKCLARNDKGEDVRTVDIRVIAKPKIDSMGELIRQEGEEITFQCIFRGEGTLRAQWVRDGTILETAEFVPSDDNRHIFNYTIGHVSAEEHMGNYTCEVSNEAGVNSRNALLKVHHAPKIISNNGTYDFVAEQSDVDLVCGASAVPIPEWTWLFNGSPLSSSIITIDNFEDGTSKLHIENFPENQYGKYTCVARNQHGDDSHTVELIRQESPEIPSLECIETPDADAIHCIDKNENGQDANAKSPEQYVVYYAEKKDVEGEGSHEVELDDDADEDGHHVSLEQDAENKLLDQGYTLQTLPYAGGHIWIRDLKPGTKYILQVAAKNGAGESNLTDAIEVETPSESAGFELPSGVGIPILIVLLLLVCGIDLLCCICRSKGLTAAICRRCCKRASEKHILEDKREQNPMLLEEDVSIERNIIKGSFRGPASSKV